MLWPFLAFVRAPDARATIAVVGAGPAVELVRRGPAVEPVVPLFTMTTVLAATHHAPQGLGTGAVGAHLLRHSLATQLVSQRRPINEVADLLGHRSIDTTAIYVKVALPQLADVALPFPGGAS